ncbi:MAG: HAD hydrolase-like protein [Verrucomicrobia bacterium]|nr:HAD hydrolase-like protein [Verrucomicrobiota bacterium]
MLLIFDLDDTLIPTSEELTPQRLSWVVEDCLKMGYLEGEKEALFTELLALHKKKESTKAVLKEFFDNRSEEGYLYAVEALYRGPLKVSKAKALTEEILLLEELKKSHLLALVTMGSPLLQREKLQLYKLEESFFEAVYIVPEEEKKGAYYEKLKEVCHKDFEEMVVIGDKIENDLYDAKKLGCKTVHIRRGRGCNQTKYLDLPDFVIDDLQELRNIVYDN